MIDYTKLKIAHELILELQDTYYLAMYVRKGAEYVLSHDNGHQIEFDSLDLLIAKLKELTQQEPKFKDAWYLINNQIKCTKVYNDRGYQFCDESHPESLGKIMYLTREELIQSQIDYWSCLKNSETPSLCVDVSEQSIGGSQESCQHESDGQSYVYEYPSLRYPKSKYKNKCIKCGEFYL